MIIFCALFKWRYETLQSPLLYDYLHFRAIKMQKLLSKRQGNMSETWTQCQPTLFAPPPPCVTAISIKPKHLDKGTASTVSSVCRLGQGEVFLINAMLQVYWGPRLREVTTSCHTLLSFPSLKDMFICWHHMTAQVYRRPCHQPKLIGENKWNKLPKTALLSATQLLITQLCCLCHSLEPCVQVILPFPQGGQVILWRTQQWTRDWHSPEASGLQ